MALRVYPVVNRTFSPGRRSTASSASWRPLPPGITTSVNKRSIVSLALSISSAAAALDMLKANETIDLLFTDVVMPGGNGRQLADEAVLRRPGLKVLFTTGYTRNAIVHHGRLDAGVQMIGKPFSMVGLAS